jgi:hypothetical protein
VSARRFISIVMVAAFAAVAGIVATPDFAHGCAMCFSGPEESRKAFFVTAAFLTLLPLGMVAGMTTWLRSRARSAAAEEAEADDTAAS